MTESTIEPLFLESLKKGWKGDCPCCGRWAQIYRRTIHAAAAIQLMRLYMLGGYDGLFVHASRLIPAGQSGSGDLSKAKYWDLIREKPHDKGAKKSSGYWSLTTKGVGFVTKTLMVPQYAYVFDDRVLALSPELMDIKSALGQKFDYEEIMNENAVL